MKQITHGNLFSGIGGWELAAERCGWENMFQVEIDKFCQKVLAKNFPKTKRYEDIKEFDGTKYRGAVDVLSASPPCQPSSVAGKRKGKSDDRWLWQETLRICGEIKPSFIIFENPPGILTLEIGKPFQEILLALESKGYSIEIFNLPAASQEAWHRRERIWILAYSGCRDTWQSSNTKKVALEQNSTENRSNKTCGSSSNGRKRIYTYSNSLRSYREEINTNKGGCESQYKSNESYKDVPGTDNSRFQKCGKQRQLSKESTQNSGWEIESCMGRMVSGLPPELDGYWDREPENVPRVATGVKDRVSRLKGLGNAVVPQIPYIFFQIIDRIIKQTQ